MCVSPVVGSCGRAFTAKTRPEDLETLVYVTLLTQSISVNLTRTSDGWDVTSSSDVYASMQCKRCGLTMAREAIRQYAFQWVLSGEVQLSLRPTLLHAACSTSAQADDYISTD